MKWQSRKTYIQLWLEGYVMYNNLYCKVYLNSELEIEELYQHINRKVSGKSEPIRTILAILFRYRTEQEN